MWTTMAQKEIEIKEYVNITSDQYKQIKILQRFYLSQFIYNT